MTENLNLAKLVMPAAGWRVDPLCGRNFRPEDVDALVELGAGDSTFAWERRIQDGDYYEGLLKFRLDHYVKFGFGVQAVLQENRLIGQAGLQVLSADQDRVEFVVFLGKSYVGRGWGRLLVGFLLSRCRNVGMSEVFGVVRHDNLAAIDLVKMCGGEVTEKVQHFGADALVYRIDLQ